MNFFFIIRNQFHIILLGTVCDTTTEEATTATTAYTGTTPCATFVSGGSANGEKCVFPFNYKGNTYYSCITIDDVNPWCSTTTDYSGRYGYCTGQCRGDGVVQQ